MSSAPTQAKKGNYWITSGALNLFQNFSGTILGMLGFMLLARLLPVSSYGVWMIFLQTGTIMELVRNGLIQNAVIKFIASKPDEEKDIFSAALVISGILSVVCIVFILCLGNILASVLKAPEMTQLLYWYIPMFIASGILMQLCCIEQAHLSYKGVVACNLARSLTFFLFLAGCYVLKYSPSLMDLLYAQIVSVVVAIFVSWIYVKKYVVTAFSFSMEWAKRIFNYGKYSFGTSLSSLLAGTVDSWIIGALLNTSSVASFSVAIRVTNLIDIPTNTIATIVFPQSAKRMETDGKEAVKYLYERSVGAILAVLIPGILFMYLFANIIITVLATPKYENTIPILYVTLAYALLIPYGRQFGAILDSIGKIRTTFFMVVFTATLNLTLVYFGVKQFGVMGAAFATMASNIVGFSIAQYILYKELNVNPIHPFIYAWQFYTQFYQAHVKKYIVGSKSLS